MNVDVGVGLSLFIFVLFIIMVICTIADIATGTNEDLDNYPIQSVRYNNYTIDNTPISYDHNDENYLDQIDDAFVIDDDL